MSLARPRTKGWPGQLHRFVLDPHSVVERQLFLAVAYTLSLLLVATPAISNPLLLPVLLSIALTAAATVAAFAARRSTFDWRLAPIIPLMDILAAGLLRTGTGGPGSVLSILIVLPVISLGVEPGRLPLLLGGVLTVAAQLPPLTFDSDTYDHGQWIRIIYTSVVLGVICLSVSEMTRRLRSRVLAIEQLRSDQEILLAEAQDHADASEASSALLRESAMQLTGIIDAVTEQAIVATDPTGRVEMFNAGAQKMLQIASHDVVGHSLLQLALFSPPEGNPVASGPGSTHDAASAPMAPENRFARLVAGVRSGHPKVRDHTVHPVGRAPMQIQVAVTARCDANGQINGFLFVGTDVTIDREQARTKDEFVNLISHELRTPLSSILGYLELIADDDENPLSQEQLQYLSTVDRNANRLLRLVSDLLFTAQVESGRFHVTKEPVELQALLTGAMETARPTANGRGVTLKMLIPDDIVTVWGDPVRLGQAIDNLISNAVKFTPAGGRVIITLNTEDDPEPRALIGITDTGIGIPPDEVNRLFSRFFRASTATANAVPGVGLGLTITKAIANAHGGQIRVASTVGEGTMFVLDLPRELSPEDSEFVLA